MTYKEYCKTEFGYDVQTTYWEDFSIAERFGLNAITDTYKRALLNKDYKMMTELSMVLNHKLWNHYQKGHKMLAELYDKLWKDCDNRCYNTFNKDEISYYYQVTD